MSSVNILTFHPMSTSVDFSRDHQKTLSLTPVFVFMIPNPCKRLYVKQKEVYFLHFALIKTSCPRPLIYINKHVSGPTLTCQRSICPREQETKNCRLRQAEIIENALETTIVSIDDVKTKTPRVGVNTGQYYLSAP